MQSLPNPNNFTTWQSWASEMQKAVESNLLELEQKKACFELVVPDAEKPRGGFPAGKNGDAIIDLTEGNIKYYNNKQWNSI